MHSFTKITQNELDPLKNMAAMDPYMYLSYGKCSKISNTLKLGTPKIIAENNFKNILKNRTLPFYGKINF